VETLRKLGFYGDLDECHIFPQGKLKNSKFSRSTSYAQQLLERVHSDVMGPFIEGYWGEKHCLLFIDEMSRKAFIKILKSRYELAAATLELIQKEQRRTQASLVYLRNDGAKDYKMKVLQDFLRQEGISHDVTERYCPQSNGMAERLNLTIMDKVCCMLIDANLTLKLWPYAAYYAVLIYNNLPHCALDNHKSPNDAYGDSSDFSKLYLFRSICYALQPSKLLHRLEERSAKGLFLEIDHAGYKVLDLQSKVA
jgi:transposase InsO family protein